MFSQTSDVGRFIDTYSFGFDDYSIISSLDQKKELIKNSIKEIIIYKYTETFIKSKPKSKKVYRYDKNLNLLKYINEIRMESLTINYIYNDRGFLKSKIEKVKKQENKNLDFESYIESDKLTKNTEYFYDDKDSLKEARICKSKKKCELLVCEYELPKEKFFFYDKRKKLQKTITKEIINENIHISHYDKDDKITFKKIIEFDKNNKPKIITFLDETDWYFKEKVEKQGNLILSLREFRKKDSTVTTTSLKKFSYKKEKLISITDDKENKKIEYSYLKNELIDRIDIIPSSSEKTTFKFEYKTW